MDARDPKVDYELIDDLLINGKSLDFKQYCRKNELNPIEVCEIWVPVKEDLYQFALIDYCFTTVFNLKAPNYSIILGNSLASPSLLPEMSAIIDATEGTQVAINTNFILQSNNVDVFIKVDDMCEKYTSSFIKSLSINGYPGLLADEYEETTYEIGVILR